MRTINYNLFNPLVPVLLAIAMTGFTQKRNEWLKYSVFYQDASYYYVTEEVSDKSAGIDYLCNSMQGRICIVNSLVEPDGYGRIPIEYAWPQYNNTIYISLE